MTSNNLKTVSVIFFILGFGAFALLNIIPALITFMISFQDYSPLRGFLGSPWVGLIHFSNFEFFALVSLFGNSIILSLIPAILAIIIAIPAARIVGGMAQGKLRSAITIALLLPAFIPDSFVVVLVSRLTLINPDSFRLIVIMLSSIRLASICAFVGANAAGMYRDRGQNILSGAVSGVIVGSAINFVGFLSTNPEYIQLITFSVADTFDTFAFRIGMMHMNFSAASVAWIIKTIMQLFTAILVSIIVYSCMHSNRGEANSLSEGDNAAPSILIASVPVIVFIVCLVLPNVVTQTAPFDVLYEVLSSAVINNIIITVLSAIVFSALLFIIASWYCININKRAALIVLLLSAAIINNLAGELLYFRSLGILNTYFAPVFANAFNLSFVLAAAYLAKLKNPDINTFGKLISSIFPYIIAFCGVYIANTWGSSFYQILYLMSQSHWGLGMWLSRPMELVNTTAPINSLVLWITVPVFLITAATALVYVLIEKKTSE